MLLNSCKNLQTALFELVACFSIFSSNKCNIVTILLQVLYKIIYELLISTLI